MDLSKITEDPNLSIILPGCNAKCDFCFGSKSTATMPGFIGKWARFLDKLPKRFYQISITGGEPSISPLLDDILACIDPDRWPKVVLSTNAVDLPLDLLDRIGPIVKHINISRHSVDLPENTAIFGCEPESGPTLERFAFDANRRGIDITFNCVLGTGRGPHTTDAILEYVSWARQCGASSVAFRKMQKQGCDLSPTAEERCFAAHKVLSETSCPVCRTKTNLIAGMPVIWKAGLYDPGAEWDGIYELIFHPSGVATKDWGGKQEIDPKQLCQCKEIIGTVPEPGTTEVVHRARFSGACGRVSAGAC